MLISDVFGAYWKPLQPGPKPGPTSYCFPVVAPKTLIGIEVEAENYHGFPATNGLDYRIRSCWQEKPEHSLRNSGVEFISGALSGFQVGEALSILHTMNRIGELMYTDLAGLHIHLNVRDWKVSQLINLVALYIVFEDSLFRVSGNRQESIYCVPARTSFSGLPELLRSRDILRAMRSANKYMGFNYATIKTFGSVEFRHSVASAEVSYILHWINTLLRIHTAAQEWDMSQLEEKIFQLNTNSEYFNFATTIFKEEMDWIACSQLNKEMREGVAVLKEWKIRSHLTSEKILDVSETNIHKRIVAKRRVNQEVAVDFLPLYEFAGANVVPRRR